MPRITLPDGPVQNFDQPVTPADVAAGIGPRLARDAIGARINGMRHDLSTVIDKDA
ncbi:MAG: TGS domain-containing protein, partial [Planctomycetota bacterium]